MPTQVEALTGFDHGGRRRKGDRFPVSPAVAKELARVGLVRIPRDPEKAPAQRSSASPAGQASPQTTAKKSKPGAKRSGQAADSDAS